MRYHYIAIRMVKTQNTENTKVWLGYKVTGALIYCWWKYKMVQPLWQTLLQFLTKLNIFLPYNPAIAIFAIYPNELKRYMHTKTCVEKCTEALFLSSTALKQPRCLSVGDWRQLNFKQVFGEKTNSYIVCIVVCQLPQG